MLILLLGFHITVGLLVICLIVVAGSLSFIPIIIVIVAISLLIKLLKR